MDRAAHLHWARERAAGCLDRGDLVEAFGSFVSDLTKHPDTCEIIASPAFPPLLAVGQSYVINGSRDDLRQWIDGFA